MKIRTSFILLIILLIFFLSACSSTVKNPEYTREYDLSHDEIVKNVDSSPAAHIEIDFNNDAIPDKAEIIEESYSTNYDSGENGGFTILFVKTEINGKVYELQLDDFRGHVVLHSVFKYYAEELSKYVLFIVLDTPSNHFPTTAIYAVAFTDHLEFVPLPFSDMPDSLYPNAMYTVNMEVTFDIESKAVIFINAATGLQEKFPLTEEHLNIAKGDALSLHSIQADLTHIVRADYAESDNSIRIENYILLSNSPINFPAGILISKLGWEDNAFRLIDQYVCPYVD